MWNFGLMTRIRSWKPLTSGSDSGVGPRYVSLVVESDAPSLS